MSFDEALAEEIRGLLSDQDDVAERRMFGGLTFMVNGHMCCGITSDDLMLRLGSEGAADALGESDARPMDFTGKRIKSFVAVTTDGLTESRLEWWVNRAVAFASALPSKEARPKESGLTGPNRGIRSPTEARSRLPPR